MLRATPGTRALPGRGRAAPARATTDPRAPSALRTPREVRNALAYVLLNARKHWRERHGSPPPERIDEASSGRWFDGWRRTLGRVECREPPDVAPPHTWPLRVGWRRHGLIDPGEVPKGRPRERRREGRDPE